MSADPISVASDGLLKYATAVAETAKWDVKSQQFFVPQREMDQLRELVHYMNFNLAKTKGVTP
jgi:hypothetical protein